MLPLLSVEDLEVAFHKENRISTAVENVNFQLRRGEMLAIVGESGSGKSVTSLSILQLLPRDSTGFKGQISFSPDGENEQSLLTASDDELRNIRGSQIAMIFQEPMTSLNPVMTCGDQIMEALLSHRSLSEKQAAAETLQWLQKVKMPVPEQIMHRYPHQLSGGQKQRVMIAMAMCCQPALLICDEPTTALDVTVQQSILTLIRELQMQHNMGVIFITHDLGVVRSIADRVAIMFKGRIIEEGTVDQIFTSPQQPYTQALIACRPALHPRHEKLPVVSDFLSGNREHQPVPVVTPGEQAVIAVHDLVVKYPGARNWMGRPRDYYIAVDGVSFDILQGETVGLVGESGCGKTTLGRALLGIVEPTSGDIFLNGENIRNRDSASVQRLRKSAQLVFQDPYSSLNARLTVGTALEEPMKVLRKELSPAERKQKVQWLLDRVGLPSTATYKYPHEFSGGQRQRIVIARALTLEPAFLICDESVSALDVSVQAQVLNLLNELKADLGLTLLFISHDLSVVRYMSNRLLVMHKGKIVESGPAEEVYRHPREAYTQSLIAAIPNL